MPASRVRCLSIHADYACRHSGACCRAGWRIPVEPATGQMLRAAVGARRLPVEAAACESDGDLTVLSQKADGACTAFEPGRNGHPHLCAIHRVLGHGTLPAACRQFPRVSLTDARGTFVTLSHFCPTAASLLFRTDVPLAIVDAPAGSRMADEHEGLDAREALPPLLRPGLLMDLESYGLWEAHAVGILADDRRPPEAALARLAHDVERLRTWVPDQGPLAERVRAICAIPDDSSAGYPQPSAGIEEVIEATPVGLRPMYGPMDAAAVDAAFVEPAWPALSLPLRRYLAARLLGTWIAYQGRGLRTIVRYLATALAIVRHEARRICAATQRPLDSAQLIDAIRAADDLLVHRADSLDLARRLSRIEENSSRGPEPTRNL